MEEPKQWIQIGTFITIGLLVMFVVNSLLKASHFPITAIDYLKAKNDLNDLVSELERKKTIDEYIDKAIQTLNLNTCPLTGENEYHFCDNPIEKGLKEVLDPIITKPNYILDCDKSKFTIALHLPYLFEIIARKDKPEKLDIIEKPKTFTFRDDFNILAFLQNDILVDLDAKGFKFNVHTAGLNTFNNKYLAESIVLNKKQKLKLITAPIPAVCEDGILGVLFVFCEESVSRPKDLENILLIFGRILANWISKYEECALNKTKET